MPFQVNWLVEKQVMYVQFFGDLTVEELRTEGNIGLGMIDESDRRLVHILIDVSGVTKSFTLKDLASMMAGRKPHPRAGWTIMVGEKDKLIKFLSSVGRQLLKLRQRSFETLPEAIQFLKEIDGTIDWNQMDTHVIGAGKNIANGS